jgi:hypothetical protein
MIFDITTFTLIHLLISLVAITAGLVVVGGLTGSGRVQEIPPRSRGTGKRHRRTRRGAEPMTLFFSSG